jgi:hypothetical protein
MPLILGANSVTGGYEIDNSLRFNSGSSDNLTRTNASATNNTKYTYSVWVKRATLGTNQSILYNWYDGSNHAYIFFATDDKLALYDQLGGIDNINMKTSAVFRDTSAWYHIVIKVDTTESTQADRVRVYINGVEDSIGTRSSQPSLSASLGMKTNSLTNYMAISSFVNSSTNYLDASMAHVYYVDGTAYDPTSFGEFDEDSGIWKPIDVSGLTFGTNGFFLEFLDSSALGDDTSGTGNDFTVNNLTSIDQTTDTPTNNFCTWNPLDIANPSYVNTLTEGNLKAGNSTGDALGYYFTTFANFSPSKGKWYWEIKVDLSPTTLFAGIYFGQNTFTTSYPYDAYTFSIPQNGLVYHNGATYTYGASFTTNDILTLALDMDSGKLYVGINGSWANGSGSTNQTFANAVSVTTVSAPFPTGRDVFPIAVAKNAFALVNFGNPPFAITTGNEDANGYGNFEHEVPSGYYSLCTKNLAEYG